MKPSVLVTVGSMNYLSFVTRLGDRLTHFRLLSLSDAGYIVRRRVACHDLGRTRDTGIKQLVGQPTLGHDVDGNVVTLDGVPVFVYTYQLLLELQTYDIPLYMAPSRRLLGP